MFLIINADKGRYDRKINIYKPTKFSTSEEAGKYLESILIRWLYSNFTDDKLLEELNYDYNLYDKRIEDICRKKIREQIGKDENYIMYSDYDSYEFDYDNEGSLTMITTGCPSDNEYIGETYQVIEIEEGSE